MDANSYILSKLDRELLSNVDNIGPHGCQLWTGATSTNGKYGRKVVLWPDGPRKTEYIHRLMYMIKNNIIEIPAHDKSNNKLEVSHLCGQSLCINKDHLTLESHQVNKERQHCHNQNVCSGHIPPCLI